MATTADDVCGAPAVWAAPEVTEVPALRITADARFEVSSNAMTDGRRVVMIYRSGSDVVLGALGIHPAAVRELVTALADIRPAPTALRVVASADGEAGR